MQMKTQNLIFICDTSALLKGYTQISNIAKKQNLTIKIPQITLNELDRIKDNKEHKENRNTHKILKNITQKDIIESSKDNALNNDDKIIKCAKNLQNKDSKIFILSEDKTFKIKFPNTLSVEEFIQKYETFSENIPNENTKIAFEKLKNNDIKTFKNILDSKEIKINAYDASGFTLLIYAIKKRNIESIKSLLNYKNIDVNKRDNSHLKMTPLAYAVQQDSIEITKILLDSNAKAYLGSKGKNKGNTPFLMASYDNRKNALHILELLIKENISINQVDSNGYSALIKAAIKGHENIAKWLVDRSIDKNLRDFKEKKALDYAKENNFTNIIKIIEG